MNSYDCGDCTDQTKAMRGCTEEAKTEAYMLGNEVVARCPKALYNRISDRDRELIGRLMQAYYFSERGILPKAGGWQDQDIRIMGLIPTINTYIVKEGARKAKAASNEKPKG